MSDAAVVMYQCPECGLTWCPTLERPTHREDCSGIRIAVAFRSTAELYA